MSILNRDVVVVIKFLTSCITAGFLIFFLFLHLAVKVYLKVKNPLRNLMGYCQKYPRKLDEGIDRRIKQLGEIPEVNPYRRFYCAELAIEIHEISYVTEKQKIALDAFNVRDFEHKSQRLVGYSETGDLKNLLDEMEIVKRELKNSATLYRTT